MYVGFFAVTGWIATTIAHAPETVRKYAGLGLLPKAGLALALALLFVRIFPQFGAGASSLVLSIVAINEIAAPVLYRFALVRSGEAKQAKPLEEETAAPEVYEEVG